MTAEDVSFDILQPRKRIALVAHDNKKDDLLAWASENRDRLTQHELFSTGTTGWLLSEALKLPITRFQSGPLGGDQQLGAKIAEREIDCLFFFWDPLESQPHDPDVKALLRIAVVWNVVIANNRATADFVMASSFMQSEYTRALTSFDDYRHRLDWRLKQKT
jgi:methylglyoxal synthase